ncbi:hypothetical protein H6F77_11680 [Microcoleus sp. FACHB-831]|uniref:hypothetical protein n=1 Tax=Microcoleus sp. FACHB-831 TaxID=2692827 RepID=UPI0016868E6C|nr:hypothetical protein [Microcoleus sp. FACHB-831]MBD1921752.1 hypothetical protein [Microcoleus sp. FACHB-831]
MFFPSKLEFFIWRDLVREFKLANVKRQVEILVKPATNRYSALTWRCDFRIYPRSYAEPYFYFNLEAKGFLTEEFRLKLQFLEFHNPNDYGRLIIVGGDRPLKIDNQFTTVTITDAIKYINSHS